MSNNSKSGRRILHWTVAAAFAAMVLTGLTLLVPALSGLAAGGWTRLLHKIAAVVLVAAPLTYAVVNRSAAGRWLREAFILRRYDASGDYVIHAWRRWHKLIISAGLVLFVATGSIQWFLKGIVPSDVFNASLLAHGVLFYAALIVLLYHVYFEFNWWMWRRRYCGLCRIAYCAESCTVSALSTTSDRTVKRDMAACNGCRLCMKECLGEGYYLKAVRRGGSGADGVD